MLVPTRLTALLFVVLAAVSSASPVRAAFVDANAMIYQAGGNTPPNALPPVLIPVPGGAGLGVSFGVTGSTDCDVNGTVCQPWTGDGNFGDDVLLASIGALGGVKYRGFYSLPLLGVFLGPALPGVSPTGLDFRGVEDFVHLFPELGQVFWIGDGLHHTGGGAAQIFHVPDGATRLFVGFYDPIPNDNSGGLGVTPFFSSVTGTPLPGLAGPRITLAASPNPALGVTRLRATLPSAGHAELRVTDAAGRLVRNLFDAVSPAGAHEWTWDGTDADGRAVGAGVYFATMRVDDRITARATVVRIR